MLVGKARVDVKTETLIEINNLRHSRGQGWGELIRKYLRRDEPNLAAAGDRERKSIAEKISALMFTSRFLSRIRRGTLT